MGYDTGLFGVSDAGNFMSALKRLLCAAPLSGVQMAVNVEAIMGPVRRAFKHWKDIEPYDYHLPLPSKVAEALLGYAVLEGDWALLTYALVGSHCGLRPQELGTMLWCDIVLFGSKLFDVSTNTFGVIRVRGPKIKNTRLQHVTIELQWIRNVLATILADWPQAPTSRVCACNPIAFRRKWDEAMSALGVSGEQRIDDRLVDKRFTPGSLRPGWATADYLAKASLSRLQWRGRWATFGVLKHYIQLGTYHMAALQMTDAVISRLAYFQNVWYEFVDACNSP
jgi:hypothetical protein